MSKTNKIIAILIIISMLIPFIPFNAFANDIVELQISGATGISGEENAVQNITVANGSVTVSGEGISHATRNGDDGTGQMVTQWFIKATAGKEITFTFNPNEGYEPDMLINGSPIQVSSENTYTCLADTLVGKPFDLRFRQQNINNDQGGNQGGGQARTFTVNFGTAQYVIEDVTVTASMKDKEINNRDVEILESDVITVTNFDSETMEVRVTGESGFNTTLNVNSKGETGLYDRNCDGLPNGKLNIVVQAKSANPPQGGDDRPQGGNDQPQEGNNVATLKVYGGSGYENSYTEARFAINNGMIRDLRPEYEKQDSNGKKYSEFTYNYNAQQDDKTITITFSSLFLNAYKNTIKVNDNTYQVSKYINYNDRTSFLNHYSNQEIRFDVEVPISENNVYEIEINLGDFEGQNIYIGNFLWTADPNQEYILDPEGNVIIENGEKLQNDVYIGHAKLRFVSATYEVGGKQYTTTLDELMDEKGNYHRAEYVEFDVGPDRENPAYEGGSLVAPDGAVITMQIIPEYGYQVEYVSSNGSQMTAGDNISEFSFTTQKGNFHLGAKVVPVEDKVNADSNKIESGNIQIANNEINSGSVQLSVDDAKLSEDKISAFTNEAEGYRISSYLNIDLNQVLYKGTSEDLWTNEMHNLNNDATISLQLAEGISSNEVVLIHNIGNGEQFEKINATYDSETKTVTFKTNSFSSYAIAYKGSPLIQVPAKSATCSEEGNIEYYRDENGNMFSDASGSRELTQADIIIPRNNTHGTLELIEAVEATCEEDGHNAYYKCPNCGKFFTDATASKETTEEAMVIDATGHDWTDWVTTKEATQIQEGEKTRTCKNNPNHVETVKIPKVEIQVVAEENTTTDNQAAKEVKELITAIVDGENVKGISETLKAKIIQATSVNVELSTEKIDEDDIISDANKVKAILEEDAKISAYFDIDVLLKIDGVLQNETITELNNTIKISVPLPTDLPAVEEGYTREYTVVRVHDGVAKPLTTTVKDNEVVFESNQFSTYALTYRDVKIATVDSTDETSSTNATKADEEKVDETNTKTTNSPKTGDNTNIYVVLMLISLIGIFITKKSLRKRK